jgi:hypothetical protein
MYHLRQPETCHKNLGEHSFEENFFSAMVSLQIASLSIGGPLTAGGSQKKLVVPVGPVI